MDGGAMAAWPADDPEFGSPDTAHVDRPPEREVGVPPARWTRVTAAGVIAAVVVAWLILILGRSEIRFVIVPPTTRAGFEVLLALLQLSAALVLFLLTT
jgi:hypothetical protein